MEQKTNNGPKNTTQKNKDQSTPNRLKNGVNSGRVRSSVPISGTLVQNLVTSHE